MLIETQSANWKHNVTTGYHDLFDSYNMIPWRWFVTMSFPRVISFEELENRLKSWIRKLEKRFPPIICALGLMVKGNGSCHSHILCFGKTLISDLTKAVDRAGDITLAGKGINDAKKFWIEQNKPDENSLIKWSDVNFDENYIEFKSGTTSKKLSFTSEQKTTLLNMYHNSKSKYIINAKYSKQSSIIPEKDAPLDVHDFIIPAKETSIVIRPVYDAISLTEYLTKPKNLQIKTDEHSEIFVFRPDFLEALKKRYNKYGIRNSSTQYLVE